MKNRRSKDDGFGQGYADMKNSFRLMIAALVLMLVGLARKSFVQDGHKDSYNDVAKAAVCQDAGADYKGHYTVIMPYYGSDSDHSCIVYENDTRQMYFACEGKNECMVSLCNDGKPVFYEKETDMDSDEMRKIVKKAAEYAGKE